MDTQRTKNKEKINAINKHTKRQVPLSYDFGFMDYAAYDYYDWVCDATLDTCQLCDVLTGSCCDPKANDNCFLPDSCANNPCLSGGTCVTTRTRDNYPDFVCVCNRGLTGKYCQLVDDFTPPLVVPVPTAVPAPGRVNPVVAPPLSRPQTPTNPMSLNGGMGMGPMGGLTGMGVGGMNPTNQVLNGMNGMSSLMGGMSGMGGLGGMGGMGGMGLGGMGMGGMGGMGMGGMGGGQSAQGGGFFGNRAGATGFGGMGGQGMGGQGMGGQGMGGQGMGGMGGMMGGMGGMGGMGAMGGMGMGGMGLGGMMG